MSGKGTAGQQRPCGKGPAVVGAETDAPGHLPQQADKPRACCEQLAGRALTAHSVSHG